MRRLHHALVAFAFVCLAGLNACGGGGGSSPPPPPPPPAAPTITTQPSGLTVNAGASATFTLDATGSPTYQWQRNGQDISGATSASYTLNPATSANNGDSYTVVASNAGGSVTSAAAALRVTGVSVLAGQIGGLGFADGAATTEAKFWGPSALALDSTGNLYVADYNTVRKITPAGVVSTIVGEPRSCGDLAGAGAAARLCYPYALAIDVAGNIYVAGTENTVWRIDANANMTEFSAAFGCIDSLAVSGPLLYVGDGCGAAGTIKTLNTSAPGTPATFAGLTFTPAGMSFDTAQNINVASGTIIQKISSAAAVSTLAGTFGMFGGVDGTGPAARFGCPLYPVGPDFFATNGAVSISTLSTGTSYVADYCNNTLRSVTSAGVVTTIGGKAGVPGATDAKGTAARFFGPAALVADANDNVFVADYLNGSIRKITPAGDVTTYAGQAPHAGYADGAGAQAAFRYPFGIVADGNGNLYVCDTYNYVIRKITPDGVVSTFAGTAGVAGIVDATGTAAKFALPQGIAIDAGGNLYVADNLANVIRKITPAGAVTTFASALTNGFHMYEPTGVAVDPDGNVYVTDLNGIYEINPAGTAVLQQVALHLATAITMAPSGTVYVTVGTVANHTTAITTAGGVFTFAGGVLTPLVTNTGFSARLAGIVVGGDGNLYVSDVLNSVIKRVTPAGVITVVAGAPDLPIATAPGGLPAKINSPTGMALLSTGSSVSLAVVDSFEHSILRVDLP